MRASWTSLMILVTGCSFDTSEPPAPMQVELEVRIQDSWYAIDATGYEAAVCEIWEDGRWEAEVFDVAGRSLELQQRNAGLIASTIPSISGADALCAVDVLEQTRTGLTLQVQNCDEGSAELRGQVRFSGCVVR